MEKRKLSILTINQIVLLLVALFSFFGTEKSFALDVITSLDDAVYSAEALGNAAFQEIGFNKITDVNFSNMTSNVTSNTIYFSADFTYTVDSLVFSGYGTWDSEEVNDTLNIELDYQLLNNGKSLNYSYDAVEDIVNHHLDETITVSFDGDKYR
jgi:hypothetical protein